MKSDTFEIQILAGPRFVLRHHGERAGREFQSVKEALDFAANSPGGYTAQKIITDENGKRLMKVVW
jgi:hypothetical protein